ncbi:uncharacterized protein LOC127848985 [Dreissena polymorpha]|uniref:uncharacterized protein LOC127848985 n=1 Tax=Dreissena polymorpha TaxID=45954 RepID=UPI00226424AF|nr:uncharacterized protein LOC127848985 [Dreissena polymorpha]
MVFITSTCLNLESSDFRCADLDQYHFCSDVNSALHSIAKEKCPFHCGFCGHTTPHTTATPCLNLESSNFRCADLDQFNFCSEVNSGLHSIAKERCPLLCGFCATTTLGNVDETVYMGPLLPFVCTALAKEFV